MGHMTHKRFFGPPPPFSNSEVYITPCLIIMSEVDTHTAHGNFHVCECYGHDIHLPDYRRDISIPRTLQGHYAKVGGCPCPPGSKCNHGNSRCCPLNPRTSKNPPPKESYRCAEGPHTIYLADTSAADRDATTGVRTDFPNSRNYGGTVKQRGPTTLTTTAQLRLSNKRRAEKKEEVLQDRKNFLKAVLRDDMLSRMDAEGERDTLEIQTGLMGTNHAVDYELTNGEGTVSGLKPRGSMMERGIHDIPSVSDQYAEIMDELKYVAAQPVGSKRNIIRLHYLVEEEERVNNLRWRARQQ